VGSVNRYSTQREEILRERQAGAVIAESGGWTQKDENQESVGIFQYISLYLRGVEMTYINICRG
jgi:hypothetical protein